MTRTPVFPHQHVPLARGDGPLWMHAIELAAPLALGQRALVVGPAKSGRTTVLREVGKSIHAAVPDAQIDVVLVDRPVEEFMEWRHELPFSTVHGTASDDDPEAHAGVDAPFAAAEEAAMGGRNAVLLVDSLTSLARALNVTMPYDERVLSGGIMQAALVATRQLFGIARAYDEGGSVTVVAVAGVDTPEELDDVVFHELVGTGNNEYRLSELARQAGLFPPIDIAGSGARHTEGILGEEEAERRARLRSEVATHGVTAGLSLLLQQLDSAKSLDALL